MEIRLDTTQKAQTQFQTNEPSQLIDQSQYESRIVFAGKESKPVELFWKAWGYVKSAAFVVYDYILWAVRCFPSIPSKLEAVEQLLDNPKEKAEAVRKDPVPFLADVFQAALIDPDGLEGLRKEEGYGEFLRALNKGIAKNIFEGIKRAPRIALDALANPFGSKDTSVLFKSLLGVLKENVPILGDALQNTCERVKNAIGSSDTDKLNALRAVCGQYLPSVCNIAKENPKAFQEFVDEVYKLKTLDDSIIPIMKKHFPATVKTTSEDIANLKICLENEGLTLSQIGKGHLAKRIGADNSINLSMAFYQGLLQAAKPEAIEKLVDLIKTDHPLLAGFGTALKDLANDPRNLKRAADNLPRAIELLKEIKKDYDTPPPEPKKDDKK